MRYNRKEGFRFAFKKPLEAAFKIYELHGREVNSHPGKALMHDLSPSGTKMSSQLNLPVSHQDEPVKIHLQFMLNEVVYEMKAELVWKRAGGNEFYYGVHFYASDDVREEIVKQLKLFVKTV
ncbi:PilZ domain-containing protein [Jeotgalibacillus haloalkalitolerans]|uniref:PilZ domain-containing protein n=1 Tax=Jeotgalibacillus haloalkalitolerans TaxID=3104292 RepID=A0ABU5KQW8_9BACL|nr:PilZ domain-containing protein [Jeotgalibacillus sp. HH7-29]MDZ5713564.1 PilZ domain-containing protein [Jeotgalibacillus sp. HH7-29]